MVYTLQQVWICAIAVRFTSVIHAGKYIQRNKTIVRYSHVFLRTLRV
ncbi:hypothetical protein ACFQ21_03365 [Ohtaekwangia kribbensis]|uniref:Uncharacterized protein n=1 Tax=Ohtaekwangia kribbensis TaxID=688913 RepID=A0ABW3JYR6_9BACT